MKHRIKQQGLSVKQYKTQPAAYKRIKLNQGYRIDLLVKGFIIVELKVAKVLANVREYWFSNL